MWPHSETCQQRMDADGNWLRQTDGKIRDRAIEREVEAIGAFKLLSGGSASLAAVDDLHQANRVV